MSSDQRVQAPIKFESRCPICHFARRGVDARRFGGRRVCAECWSSLSRTERQSAFRGHSRASLVALFMAEVAVRQAS
jgi:hypothetical protein